MDYILQKVIHKIGFVYGKCDLNSGGDKTKLNKVRYRLGIGYK